MIADFFVGTWLSNALRWPECFGMSPAFKEEALTLGHLLLGARLVLETALCLGELPYPSKGHRTFNITALNSFISQQRQRVLNLYTSLLN